MPGAEEENYWLRWQVPVCATIIFLPAVVGATMAYRTKTNRPRISHLWIPSWRNLSPIWLLCFRALVAVSMSCILGRFILEHGISVFYFYTQWTFSLVIFYFVLGTVISAHGCWTSSKRSNCRSEERAGCLENYVDLEQEESTATPQAARLLNFKDLDEKKEKFGFWGSTMLVVYQICAGAVMMTDVVFWCLIVPFLSGDHFSVNIVMGSMHTLNLVFLLLDTALNSMPITWFGMSYFVLWSCAYVAFEWILHACGVTWWPYPFLELATPWAPVWYLCLALVHIPCYFSYYAVVKAKDRFFSKWFPNSYIRSSS